VQTRIARIARIAWLALLPCLGCKVRDLPPITERWTDSFDRSSPGASYYASGDGYDVADDALSAKGAHNHPLWLRRKLPHDVRIEFTAWSTEPRGDIKVEVFGDGHSYDPDGGRYTATGYEVIFGGWFNTKSIIARLDEHGDDVKARSDVKVAPNQRYRWKIERQGHLLRWSIDDRMFLEIDDPRPLEGTGHEYFGFNNWETDTWFDDLVITPL
jgi:farnesoic acid O-methyltransferase